MQTLETNLRNYDMVVDVEAIVLPTIDIVMQVGYVLVDQIDRRIIRSVHHYIAQPYDMASMTRRYKCSARDVLRGIYGYQAVTGDYIIRRRITSDGTVISWNECKKNMGFVYSNCVSRVFAKGKSLECRVFKGVLGSISDLEDFGCPKYPYKPHNPMLECQFFADYIPRVETPSDLAMESIASRRLSVEQPL